MGDFRIEINAAGGHGCQRENKDGSTVYGCGYDDCPDCMTASFVAEMIRKGLDVKTATFTHWPGEPCEVKDEFLTKEEVIRYLRRAPKIRRGNF